MAFSFFKKTKTLIFRIESNSVSLVDLEIVKGAPVLKNAFLEAVGVPILTQEGLPVDNNTIWSLVVKLLKQANLVSQSQEVVEDFSALASYDIAISVSDKQVFTSKFSFDLEVGKNFDDELAIFCVNEFPIAKDDVISSYILDHKAKSDQKGVANNKSGIVNVIDRQYARIFRSMFEKYGLIVDKFVSDSSSLWALLKTNKDQDPKSFICLLDLSFEGSSLIFFKDGEFLYERSIPFGFRYLEVEAMKQLNKPDIDIRDFILKHGFTDLNKKETNALFKASDALQKHLQDVLQYIESESSIKVSTVCLSSYASLIPGLAEYLSANLNKKVSKITSPIWLENQQNELAKAIFSCSIGAGLVSLGLGGDPITPVIQVDGFFKAKRPTGIFGTIKYYSGMDSESKKVVPIVNLDPKVTTGNPIIDKEVAENLAKEQKLKSSKRKLIFIVVLGAVLVALAFVARSILNSYAPKKDLSSQVRQYAYSKEVTFDEAVAVDPSQYTADRIRGRLAVVAVKAESNYLDTQKKALADAKVTLRQGENIWDIPVLSAQANEDPARFTFVVYNVDEAKVHVDNYIKNRLLGSDYVIGNIEYLDVVSTDNPSIYILKIKFAVGSSNILNETTPTTSVEVSPSPTPSVIEPTASSSKSIEPGRPATTSRAIIKGDGAPVNMHSSPSLTATLISKIGDKTIVDILGDEDSWYKVRTDDELEGWIKKELIDSQIVDN